MDTTIQNCISMVTDTLASIELSTLMILAVISMGVVSALINGIGGR